MTHRIYEAMATSHPKLERGQVWCRKCGRCQTVNSADCFKSSYWVRGRWMAPKQILADIRAILAAAAKLTEGQ